MVFTHPEPPDRAGRRAPVQPWLTLAARLVLATVWTRAALAKIGDPAETVGAVRAYELVPEALVPLAGYSLPFLELGLALLLAAGLATRFAAAASATVLVVFTGAVGLVAMRGLKIDCGCFGGGGPVESPDYLAEILRDSALVAVAGFVAFFPASPLSLDAAGETGTGTDGQRAGVTLATPQSRPGRTPEEARP